MLKNARYRNSISQAARAIQTVLTEDEFEMFSENFELAALDSETEFEEFEVCHKGCLTHEEKNQRSRIQFAVDLAAKMVNLQ